MWQRPPQQEQYSWEGWNTDLLPGLSHCLSLEHSFPHIFFLTEAIAVVLSNTTEVFESRCFQFYFMCMSVLPACVYDAHVCVVPVKIVGVLGLECHGWLPPPYGCWEPSLDPLHSTKRPYALSHLSSQPLQKKMLSIFKIYLFY